MDAGLSVPEIRRRRRVGDTSKCSKFHTLADTDAGSLYAREQNEPVTQLIPDSFSLTAPFREPASAIPIQVPNKHRKVAW